MEFLRDVPAFRERSLKWRLSSFPMVLRSLLEGSGIIMRILAISGSLRAASSNGAVLQAATRLAPAGVEVVHYKGLGDLPHFNPDLDTDDPPEVVRALRYEIGRCDGLLICSPEYAHGVAGSMKNALDWLVSSVEFPEKWVALINTSQRAVHGDAQLREILTTMSARLIERASIILPLWGRNLDATGIISDPALSEQLRTALEYFVGTIRLKGTL
jgi:chromate reductase